MSKIIISTPEAPAAIGPYSQGVGTPDLVFTSGQLPLDPVTGDMVGETAAEQAEQCLKNLKAVLLRGGSSLDGVIKTLVFLVDMNDFGAVNEVYSRYFGKDFPARSCVAVKGLPRGAKVEIECVAGRWQGV